MVRGCKFLLSAHLNHHPTPRTHPWQGLQLTKEQLGVAACAPKSYEQSPPASTPTPSLIHDLQGLHLTKEQLRAAAEGGSLRTARQRPPHQPILHPSSAGPAAHQRAAGCNS